MTRARKRRPRRKSRSVLTVNSISAHLCHSRSHYPPLKLTIAAGSSWYLQNWPICRKGWSRAKTTLIMFPPKRLQTRAMCPPTKYALHRRRHSMPSCSLRKTPGRRALLVSCLVVYMLMLNRALLIVTILAHEYGKTSKYEDTRAVTSQSTSPTTPDYTQTNPNAGVSAGPVGCSTVVSPSTSRVPVSTPTLMPVISQTETPSAESQPCDTASTQRSRTFMSAARERHSRVRN